MTVSMIENWSTIFGLVQAVSNDNDLRGFEDVELFVERVEPVEDYPELVSVYLEENAAKTLCVLMPAEIVAEYEISDGVWLECRVRRAGLERIFVHQDYVVVRPSLAS
jgi:hypothetical protein